MKGNGGKEGQLQHGGDVWACLDQCSSGQADDALVGTASRARWQPGRSLVGDVGADDGEITRSKFKNVGTSVAARAAGHIRCRTKSS